MRNNTRKYIASSLAGLIDSFNRLGGARLTPYLFSELKLLGNPKIQYPIDRLVVVGNKSQSLLTVSEPEFQYSTTQAFRENINLDYIRDYFEVKPKGISFMEKHPELLLNLSILYFTGRFARWNYPDGFVPGIEPPRLFWKLDAFGTDGGGSCHTENCTCKRCVRRSCATCGCAEWEYYPGVYSWDWYNKIAKISVNVTHNASRYGDYDKGPPLNQIYKFALGWTAGVSPDAAGVAVIPVVVNS